MPSFARTILVTGSSAQNLLTILVAAGFNSNPMADELVIVPSTGDCYTGDVNTINTSTGFPVPAGSSARRSTGNQQSPIDISRIWIYSATTQNIGFRIQTRG